MESPQVAIRSPGRAASDALDSSDSAFAKRAVMNQAGRPKMLSEWDLRPLVQAKFDSQQGSGRPFLIYATARGRDSLA